MDFVLSCTCPRIVPSFQCRSCNLHCSAFSRVFECDINGYQCAIKICPLDTIPREGFIMLLRELRLVPWLNHPNLVQFLGYAVAEKEVR
jgi:hypothetical protein